MDLLLATKHPPYPSFSSLPDSWTNQNLPLGAAELEPGIQNSKDGEFIPMGHS